LYFEVARLAFGDFVLVPLVLLDEVDTLDVPLDPPRTFLPPLRFCVGMVLCTFRVAMIMSMGG
jgi:hypothetical protein